MIKRLPLLLVVLALVACSKPASSGTGGQNPPPSDATATETDLKTVTQSYDASASTVRDGSNSEMASYLSSLQAPFTLRLADFLGLPDFFSQVGGLLGAQSVAAQANSTLPRGSWDCTSGSCGSPTNSPDYDVKWKTPDGKYAEIYLDWDGSSSGTSSSTVIGHLLKDPSSTIEVPTKLIGRLTLADDAGGKNLQTLMTLSRSVSYPRSICVSGSYVIDVPDVQRLTVSLKRTDGTVIFNVKNFETTVGSNSVVTKGDISANARGQTVNAAWNLSTSGTVLRGKCGEYSAIIANNLSGSLSTDNTAHALAFTVGANKFSQNPASITFTDSMLTVDGKTVKFSGSTEDTNKDGYIGDDLTLSFAGGQTLKLADYLKKYHPKK
jgi:hypothetical protein